LIKNKPNEIVVARLGSPLAGNLLVKMNFFLLHQCFTFIEYTKNTIYLEKEYKSTPRLKMATFSRSLYSELQLNLEQIEKGGYDHFMLEIFEQPSAIQYI
jgi:glucosamine--fructose-6-phosphate aminotransferase (isomerizing)